MTNCIVIKMQAATFKKIERNGKFTLFFNEQLVAIETGEDFLCSFKLTLKEGQQPYVFGRYQFDASFFEVGDFDSLKIGRNVAFIAMLKTEAPTK